MRTGVAPEDNVIPPAYSLDPLILRSEPKLLTPNPFKVNVLLTVIPPCNCKLDPLTTVTALVPNAVLWRTFNTLLLATLVKPLYVFPVIKVTVPLFVVNVPVPKLTVPLIVLDPLPDIVNPKFVLLTAEPLAGFNVKEFASTYIVEALASVIVPPHTFVPDKLRKDPALPDPFNVNDSSPTLILLFIYNVAPLVILVPPTTLPNEAL